MTTKSRWKVLIAHARGEENLAEKLAAPIRQVGYEVVHLGTVLVGDSIVEEASKAMSTGGPVVLCGTVQAAGTKWARRLINAAQAYEQVRVFAVQMEEEADLDSLALDGVVTDYWKDPSRAMRELLTALQKRYPLHDVSPEAPAGYDAELKYRKLALDSCDIIDLANLPETERHLAARRLELRRLYVPLRVRLEISKEAEAGDEALEALERKRELLRRAVRQEEETGRHPLGERLSLSRRLVVLGDPGAGKSTLIRWIATAYLLRLKEDPDWKDLPDVTTLPHEDWLPILIRCRDLDPSSVSGSLDDMLWRTLSKSELPEKEARALRMLLRERLHQQRAILLIDGLDEIADPTLRARFCRQVEQIHLANPNAPIIVTSRVVGYREMRHRIGQGFEHVTVTDLSREEKDEFAHRWSALTEPPGRQTLAADELIRDIHSTDRIERLTGNPMLLTTLALVKRKVGKLPRRRADLYSEAVQVLLNWRAEVDEPIDSNEAIPQLEYVAYAMCERGVQQLRKNEILKLLHRMREEYPQVHAVRAHTPEAFLPLLERRTGILVEAGHVRHLGAMEPVFEFRHLTFQEYLAARALVDGRFPGRNRSHRLAENVAPLVGRAIKKEEPAGEIVVTENWREALRLCVVCCSDDDVDDVLRAILKPPRKENPMLTARPRAVLAALCLADEPNANNGVATEVLKCLVGHIDFSDASGRSSLAMAAKELALSRWAKNFQSLLIEAFRRKISSMRHLFGDLYSTLAESLIPEDKFHLHKWLKEQESIIAAADEEKSIGAALSISRLHVWRIHEPPSTLVSRLLTMLTISAPSAHAAALALTNLAYGIYWHQAGWFPSTTEVGSILAFLDRPTADPEAVALLLKLLGAVQEPRCLQPAIAKLADKSPTVRSSAAQALRALQDPQAVQPLINRLRDPESYVTEYIVEALGELRDRRAVDTLLPLPQDASLLTDAKIRALGKIQDPRAIQPLLEKLRDEGVRSYIRGTVLEALGNISAHHTIPLLADELRSSDAFVRRAAAELLGKLAEAQHVQPLIDCLSDPDDSVRRHAVEALGHLRDARAVQPLIERLQDPESLVRRYTASALGELRDPRAVHPLIDKLLNDSDPSVSLAAAHALGVLKEEGVIQPLLEKIDSLTSRAKLPAIIALGKLQDKRAIPFLLGKLQDPDSYVSFAAALALGELQDARAIQPLFERLGDAEPSIRYAAAEALSKLDDPSVPGLLEQALAKDSDARRYAFHALLVKLQDPTDKALLSRKLDGNWPPWALRDAIDEVRVRYAAGRLKLPEEEVKRRYEALAQRFPLKLAWRS